MRSKSHNRYDSQYNEFLSQPNLNSSLLSGKKENPRFYQPYISKDAVIKSLEDRNQKLRAYLIKIQEVLDEKPYEEKKEHKLIPIESSEYHMRKELYNVYKHIKNYEFEIKKLEDGNEGGLVTNRMQKLENIYTEKAKHIDKLRAYIQQITKSSNYHAKKLKDNNLKDDLENQMIKFNEEIKFLRERVKDAEAKEKMKQTNAKKQYDYIKKLEKVLVDNGCSIDELEEVRNRISSRDKGYANVANSEARYPREGEVEDQTVDKYLEMKNELKLLKKMQGDYYKKMYQLYKEKDYFQTKNVTSRNKLLECETEIEELEKYIRDLKTRVKPENMRPIRSISTTENPIKATKIKRVSTSIQKNKGTLSHILKFDEVGMTSEKGQRFTDRNILGKATNTKLIGANVFVHKALNFISGLQSIYKMGEFKKPGGEYVRKDKDMKDPYYDYITFECYGDEYVKSITGTLNANDYLEHLSFVTSTGRTMKFGQAKTYNKQFSFDIAEDEVAVCMFGSLLIKTEPGKKDYSIVYHLGFEINQDAKAPKEAMAYAGTGTSP